MKIIVLRKDTFKKLGLVFLFVLFSIFIANEDTYNVLGVFLQNGKELPIYSVETQEKKVAFSFDAAWGTEYTEDILKILKERNIKTTFFLVGFWVDKHPDMVKKIVEDGHEIGNHSSTHPHMTRLKDEQIRKELEDTSNKIQQLTGKRPILFRPPYGDYNDRVIKTARELGYYVIQWDVDSLDWKELGIQPIIDRVTSKVKNGSIILFHNNAKYTAKALPVLIDELQQKGYKIVPVSELIYKDNYYVDHEGRQRPLETNNN